MSFSECVRNRAGRPGGPLWAAWVVLLGCVVSCLAGGPNTLDWNAKRDSVSADITSASLYSVLKQVAASSGWDVYVEPNLGRAVSAKFENVKPGEGLRLLLGGLNYAVIPGPTGAMRLYVFRTDRRDATEQLSPADLIAHSGMKLGKPIPRELVVRLKPGAKIEEWARLLGAKITGRIDSLNAYRLEFPDDQSTENARKQLAASSDVESVDSNYSIDRPPGPEQGTSQQLPPPIRLTLNPPPSSGRIIVGLIDTGVQSLGGDLDKFLLKPITIASGSADAGAMSHGTSMYGTMLRGLEEATKGGTSVQILPVDVYGSGVGTSTFAVSQGITEAVNAGAGILNLSLGSSSDDPLLRDVIRQATSKNIPIFAAAGNEPVASAVYPAAYPGVHAVTAVDHGQLAPYANRGSFVSLGVPGTSVVYYQGKPYQVVGTSAASATAAALAAGHMDAAKVGTSEALNYLRRQYGVRITPAGSR